MTYRIVADSTRDNLEGKVNQHLAMGWELVGGVTYSSDTYQEFNARDQCHETSQDCLWAQAMLLRQEKQST